MYEDQILNSKYVWSNWSIFVISARFIPLKNYALLSQLMIVPRIQYSKLLWTCSDVTPLIFKMEVNWG